MELLREGYKRLAVIAGGYYGGFKKFSLFTKIFVIIGILFFELILAGLGLSVFFTVHFTMIMLFIFYYNKIEFWKNQKIELEMVGLSDEEKAALNSERVNVDIIGTLGIPVPESLRPEERKYKIKLDSIKNEEREGKKLGFAQHPSLENNDLNDQNK
jgi:hypothetical protein